MLHSLLQRLRAQHEGRVALHQEENELDKELLIKVRVGDRVQGERKAICILEEEFNQFDHSGGDWASC